MKPAVSETARFIRLLQHQLRTLSPLRIPDTQNGFITFSQMAKACLVRHICTKRQALFA